MKNSLLIDCMIHIIEKLIEIMVEKRTYWNDLPLKKKTLVYFFFLFQISEFFKVCDWVKAGTY